MPVFLSELHPFKNHPFKVRDDAATIIMVDSNFQREGLLPSERVFAYKMKLEAKKHQGERTDLTSSQVGTKLRIKCRPYIEKRRELENTPATLDGAFMSDKAVSTVRGII